MKKIDISVIAPCYNEEAGVDELVKRVKNVLKKLNFKYEIILINDGSKDNTWEEIKKNANKNSEVKGICFSRNFGQQCAVSAGLSECSGDLALIMDADLQNPPELLPQMLKKMEETNADIVYGNRVRRKGDSWFKVITSKIFCKILYYLSDNIFHSDAGEFRIINRKVIDAVNSMPESLRFLRGLFSWVGFKHVAFDYICQERFAGKTHYSLSKMVSLAIDAITAFSVKPLRITFIFGIISAFLGIIMLFYVFYVWYHFDTVSGWTSIISLILIMSSFQFILLGLIGEYVGRIFIESKKRPHYIIKEIYNKKIKKT